MILEELKFHKISMTNFIMKSQLIFFTQYSVPVWTVDIVEQLYFSHNLYKYALRAIGYLFFVTKWFLMYKHNKTHKHTQLRP